MAPRYVVSCLAPCRGGARKVLGLTPSSESVCPGCEGGSSLGEGLVHIGTYSRKLLQTDTRMYAGMPDTITDFLPHIIFLYLCFAYFPCICLMLMACTDRDLPPRDFGIIFHLPEVR